MADKKKKKSGGLFDAVKGAYQAAAESGLLGSQSKLTRKADKEDERGGKTRAQQMKKFYKSIDRKQGK